MPLKFTCTPDFATNLESLGWHVGQTVEWKSTQYHLDNVDYVTKYDNNDKILKTEVTFHLGPVRDAAALASTHSATLEGAMWKKWANR